MTLEFLDLNEVTREVMALSLSDLQRSRVALQSQFAADLPTVAGDRIQIQQVILNLLRNAADAMADVHDRPRQLAISTELEAGGRVRLSVRDAGVGVDPRSMTKLLDAFYTTKADGMGIGLWGEPVHHRETSWPSLGQSRTMVPGPPFRFRSPAVQKARRPPHPLARQP